MGFFISTGQFLSLPLEILISATKSKIWAQIAKAYEVSCDYEPELVEERGNLSLSPHRRTPRSLRFFSAFSARKKEVTMWYEDMFTYEGVPMKAPTNAGMKGTQNWQYDREKMKHESEQENEEEEPVVLVSSYPLTIPLFQNTGIVEYSITCSAAYVV